MEILTVEVDENSVKGKAFIDFIKAFFSEEGDVQLIAIDGLPINNSSESDLNFVAENVSKYKTARKSKKEVKKNSDLDSEESPYNPEFVKMVLDSAKSKNRTTIDPNDIWGSLGLK